jgi:hypothetical protein
MDVEERMRELVGLMAICSLPRSSRRKHSSHPRLALQMEPQSAREWPWSSNFFLKQEQTYEGFTFLGPCERHDDTPRQILRRDRVATEYTHEITLDNTAKRCWWLVRGFSQVWRR